MWLKANENWLKLMTLVSDGRAIGKSFSSWFRERCSVTLQAYFAFFILHPVSQNYISIKSHFQQTNIHLSRITIPLGISAYLASRLCFDTAETSNTSSMQSVFSRNIKNPLSGFRSFTFQSKLRRGMQS